jgi:Family of unknown function (DUF6535)
MPEHAIVIITLWSLSLTISLTCALLATLQQQWARRYVKITHKRHHPRNRARIRAFFSEGVDKLHLHLAAEVLPTLLHFSLFLFFAGFVVFLYHFSFTIFKIVGIWVGICTFLYACITFLPILRYDSPYYTPLSTLAWLLYTGLLCIFFQSLKWLTAFNCCRRAIWIRCRTLRDQYYKRFLHGMEKAAEDFALGLPPEIDGRALIRTLESLDEDEEIEAFFEGIPGFFNSAVVSDARAAFKIPNGEKISEVLVGFMCRTLSSNIVPEPVKRRRIKICSRAVEAASLPIDRRIFDRVLYKDWDGLLHSVEFGLFLRGITYSDPFSAYYSQCVISVIIARVQDRDSSWFQLTMGQLGVSKPVLQDYLNHGDSLLLAICNSICRRTMHAYSEHGWHRDVYTQSRTFEVLSELDVQHTLPRLKREFCALWNELVESAQSPSRNNQQVTISILRNIRKVYIHLHQDNANARDKFFTSSDDDSYLSLPHRYPSCDISSHRSSSVLRFSAPVVGTPSIPPRRSHTFPPFKHPCAVAASLVLATVDTTHHPTSKFDATISSAVDIHPPIETEPPPAFPVPAHHNTRRTNPPFPLPTPVCQLDCSQQTHPGPIGFPSTTFSPSFLTPRRTSFVSSHSVTPDTAVGVHGDARDLSSTLAEGLRHPRKTVRSFLKEAHPDAGQSAAYSRRWAAEKRS